jgi:hypothetical protein
LVKKELIYLLPPLLLVPFSTIAGGRDSTAGPASSGYELCSRGATTLGIEALDNILTTFKIVVLNKTTTITT